MHKVEVVIYRELGTREMAEVVTCNYREVTVMEMEEVKTRKYWEVMVKETCEIYSCIWFASQACPFRRQWGGGVTHLEAKETLLENHRRHSKEKNIKQSKF